MTDELPETTRFGLTRIGDGEALSKNGWSFTDLDRLKLDALLYAALTHKHDGSPALGDPTDPPTLIASPTGGHLPAATSFFYRVSFVDQHGLESMASSEASVTTPDPLVPPTAPSATTQSDGGTILPGIYSYLITYTDAYGGETTPSSISNVEVIGGSTNIIQLDLPDLVDGATGYAIYRSRPGQSSFYQVAAVTSASWTDTGLPEDQTVQAPTENTTNAANSVAVTIPLGFIPLGCAAWRIYRASFSGGYDGNSLVHEVIEGESETSPTPRTVWTDTGDALMSGFPQNQSSTVPSGSILSLNDLQGTLPLNVIPRGTQSLSAYAGGVVTNQRIVTVTEAFTDIVPLRFTAFFETPPSNGTTVHFSLTDTASPPNMVVLTCPSAPAAGDPVGYYHVAFADLQSLIVPVPDQGILAGAAQIVPDAIAYNQQAVNLPDDTSSATVNLGPLIAGQYTILVNARPIAETPAVGDLIVDVIRADTSAVVTSQSFELDNVDQGYRTLIVGPLVVPGNTDVHVVVRKSTTAAQSYNVDLVIYEASLPLLKAGRITLQATVEGGPTSAAGVNLALWF